MPTLAELRRFLDRFAPPKLAAEWDNVGLLLGDADAKADRVMTCLTITSDVVAEAVAERVDLIVAHHPVLFRGVKKLTSETPEGKLLLPLVRAGTAIYSPHTSFDNCLGGINDGLVTRLGLIDVKPLRDREAARDCKLVVFVPDADLQKVSDAIFSVGGGIIGQYEQCSFRLSGTGTFFGAESTNPTVGRKGVREQVPEWRLESIVPESKVRTVVEAMRKAHSYEEPAYDVYPLVPRLGGGEGRIGRLPAMRTLGELAGQVKSALNARFVHLVGSSDKSVERVAIACGAAGEFLTDAIRAKADVFLTGEMRFHDLLTAESVQIGLILPGHYATERPGVEDLAARLASEFPAAKVWASRREREPLDVL